MTSAAALGLTPRQFAWAQKIVAHIEARKFAGDDGTYGKRIADITLATALVESGLKMYANGNNPASLKIPHDDVGWDHGSVGLFQQQVGGAVNSTANWGTTAELMDVNTSTDKFVDALLRHDWLHMTNGAVAQAVQGSAFPARYAKQDARAIAIRTALWGAVPTPSGPAPASVGVAVPFPIGGKMSAEVKTLVFNPGAVVDATPRYLLWGDKGYVTIANGPSDILSGSLYVAIDTADAASPDAAYQVQFVIDTVDSTGRVVVKSASLGGDEFPHSSGRTMHQSPVPPVHLNAGQRLRVKLFASNDLQGKTAVAIFRGTISA